jgi:hypothetical protein
MEYLEPSMADRAINGLCSDGRSFTDYLDDMMRLLAWYRVQELEGDDSEDVLDWFIGHRYPGGNRMMQGMIVSLVHAALPWGADEILAALQIQGKKVDSWCKYWSSRLTGRSHEDSWLFARVFQHSHE